MERAQLLAQHRTLWASVSSSAEWTRAPHPQVLTTQLRRWSDLSRIPFGHCRAPSLPPKGTERGSPH